MSVYKIHEDNIARLEDKLKKIEKKCAKLGCTYNYKRIGEVYEEVKHDDGTTAIAKFIEVEVEGKAIINDWEVIARVDHETNGVIISKVCFDVEIPAKYTLSDYNHCEHCNSRRNRKVVYVLRHTETGEWKQVGATCLKEFTHGLDAEMAASFLAMFDELVEWDAVTPSSSYRKYYNLRDYLRYCVECVNKFGYVRSHDGYSTAERAWDYFMLKEYNWAINSQVRETLEKAMNDVQFNANTDEAAETVDKVIEYVLSCEADSDYIITIQTLAKDEYFNCKYTGFIASMVVCYHKHIAKMEKAEAEKKAAAENPSRYIGNVGERMTREIASAELVHSFDNQYGMTFFYRIIDTDGNVLMWRSSNWLDLDHFDFKTVTFTVKSHEEYRGIQQTHVTRCKFAK